MVEINTIYNLDCLDGMKMIDDKSVDCIICDLPYGTTACSWDTVIPFNKLWEQYNRIIKDNGAILLFGQEPFSSYLRLSNIENYKYDIYWQKERLTNIQQVKRRVGKDVECISVFYKKQCTYNPQMIDYNGPKRTNKIGNGKLGLLSDSGNKKPIEYKDNGKRYPTQKPVALLEELIKTFSNKGDLILDNCMGSGSTAIACMNTNRNYIGFETDKEYYRISLELINKHAQGSDK
jgi:site-specific DNA-methyltransferase (adenine-specific)